MNSTEYWSFMLTNLASTFPCHLCGYIPFLSHLRYSKNKSLVIFTATQMFYMLYCSFVYWKNLPYDYAQIMALPIYGISFFLCLNLSMGKLAFLYIFIVDYCMIVRGIGAYLSIFLIVRLPLSLSLLNSLISISLFLLTIPAMFIYFKKTLQLIEQIDAPVIWKTIWLLPLFNSIVVFSNTFPMNAERTTILSLLSRVVLIISMFLLYYYVIQILLQFRKQAQFQDRLQHLEQLTHLQKEHYESILSRIEDTRRARHDLRQHLRAIQGYIDNNDIPSLNNYIQNVTGSLPTDTAPFWSGNPTVDAILGFYAQKAYANGIDMKISFQAQIQTIIPEHEFCVLLGNLLENALDACLEDNSPRRNIRVHIMQTGSSMVTLTVDNTSAKPPVINTNGLLSSKHPGLGIGTESVRLIAEYYNGDARFEWEDGIFCASVILNP